MRRTPAELAAERERKYQFAAEREALRRYPASPGTAATAPSEAQPIPTAGNLPNRQHPDDAGADLIAAHTAVIMPGGMATVSTGTALALPPGTVGIVAARSGLAFKHGIGLVNSIGVIDAGYRGDIAVRLINHGERPFEVFPGDRIAQLLVVPILLPGFEPAESLDATSRGRDGFGSTGI